MKLAYRSRAPYRSRALPASTIPEAKLEWVLFDRCIMEGPFAHSSTVAVAETSNRGVVRVSLRLAAPPSISYVRLDTDDYVHEGPPMVIAADGDLLLIHMVVAVDDAPSCSLFPDNFFVYKADPEWPWLKRLPSQGDWMGRPPHTGILHSGGKNFVAAELQVRVVSLGPDAHEVAELLRFSSESETNLWELKQLDMPYDREKGLYPLCWETDTVFSYDGYMCWADYHRGVLFCDILTEDPDLRFVPFPGIEDWEDFSEGRGLPEMYRTVTVSEGKVCFVDIDDGRFRSMKTPMCLITTWTLKTPELVWVKEHTVHLTKLWSHWRYLRSPMPRCVPRFPVVNMHDSGIVHFILSDSALSTENWMLTVDMKNGYLKSYTMYKNAIEEPDMGDEVKNVFWDVPLLCSELSRHLNFT